MTITNPEGFNQHVVDPRQAKFIEYYFVEDSPTFSNALQSALKAGYAQEYAERLTTAMPTWLSERIADAHVVALAERNVKSFLNLEESDNGKLKVKADITKWSLERLNRKKYGNRVEVDVKTEYKGFSFVLPQENQGIDASQDAPGSTETNGRPIDAIVGPESDIKPIEGV